MTVKIIVFTWVEYYSSVGNTKSQEQFLKWLATDKGQWVSSRSIAPIELVQSNLARLGLCFRAIATLSEKDATFHQLKWGYSEHFDNQLHY